MSNSLLSVRDLCFSIKGKQIIQNVSFNIDSPMFICFLGPSGCGKTTMLNLIAGFEKPTSGSIFSYGNEITSLPTSKRNFGIVFQNYALFPNLTIKDNITFGLNKLSNKEKKDKCLSLLNMIDLVDCIDKYPYQLSGGQQQRVALARAIAPDPKILLLDEPLSALDAKIREHLRNDLRLFQRKLEIPIIMVTHDQEEALAVSDKIVLMDKGSIVQVDTPDQLYFHPKNTFVANFIGSVNQVKFPEWNQGNLTIVRYEHLEINAANESTTQAKESIIFKVIDYRFLGSFYRFTLLYSDQKTIIYADIPYTSFNIKHLENEQFVSVTLKQTLMSACND